MQDGRKGNVYAIVLLIALVLFILMDVQANTVASISDQAFYMRVISAVLLLLLVCLYAIREPSQKIISYKYSFFLTFTALIAASAAQFIVEKQLSVSLLIETFSLAYTLYYYIPIMLVTVLLACAGAYFTYKKNILLAILFLVIAFSIFIIQNFAFQYGYIASDEMVLSYYTLPILANHSNPYSYSIASTMYGMVKNPGIHITLTTTNQYNSVMDYPALFFLSSYPFYLAFPYGMTSLDKVITPLTNAIWAFLLVVVLAFCLPKEELLKPKFALIVFVALVFLSKTSPVVILGSALLILCYQKLDSRYSWAFIGLAVSLQEQLWFPCVLLLLYAFNNTGYKKGLRMTMYTIAVFLLINSYFIVLNPVAFFNDVFAPLNTYIMPNTGSQIGYYILTTYHVLTPALNRLFELAMLLLALFFLYLNKKELVGLFSFIPYLFLSHALIPYYTLPALLFAFSLYARGRKENRGWLRGLMGTVVAKSAFYAVVIAVFVLCCVAIYYSHLAYASTFNITITNQTMDYNGTAAIYSAELHHSGPVPNAIYFGVLGLSNWTVYSYGFSLSQILGGNKTGCNSYSCVEETNRITLTWSNSSYEIKATIPSNSEISYIRPVLYTGAYYYTPNVIYGGRSPLNAPPPKSATTLR